MKTRTVKDPLVRFKALMRTVDPGDDERIAKYARELHEHTSDDETAYVFVYHPPQGWDLDLRYRDWIVETGNVLEIVRSELYSLQWTELHLDHITRRPLTVVLYNMSDRYGYGEGSGKNEPFEVVEVKSLSDAAKVCDHLRYREWPDTITYSADPESPYPEDRRERTVGVIKHEWRHLYSGAVHEYGHRPSEESR
jgi:hypothetical protein